MQLKPTYCHLDSPSLMRRKVTPPISIHNSQKNATSMMGRNLLSPSMRASSSPAHFDFDGGSIGNEKAMYLGNNNLYQVDIPSGVRNPFQCFTGDVIYYRRLRKIKSTGQTYAAYVVNGELHIRA